MADAAAPRKVTRRTFLGWWMAIILTSLTVAGVLPILVYLWPAPPKGQKKGPVNISLPKPIDQIADAEAAKFHAPSHPNTAFILPHPPAPHPPRPLPLPAFALRTAPTAPPSP